MQAPLLALLALGLVLAVAPTSVSAAPGAVCVPPGSLNQLCVGSTANGYCAWTPTMRACAPHVTADPVCVPPGSLNQVCVGRAANGDVCAWAGGGPVTSFVCFSTSGKVTSCSNSLYGPLYGAGWHCLGDPIP